MRQVHARPAPRAAPEPTSGTVVFDGVDISKLSRRELRPLRREMQMIFQDPYASLNPRKRVIQIVGAPLHIHGVGSTAEIRERVLHLLDVVGLSPHHIDRFPHEFSGGQRQRIGVARALALSPQLIVADEPVSALDVSIQAQVVNLLDDLQDEFNLTYVFIAHDLGVIRHVSDRIAVMYLGLVVEMSPPTRSTCNRSTPIRRRSSRRSRRSRRTTRRVRVGPESSSRVRFRVRSPACRLPLPPPVQIRDRDLPFSTTAAGRLRRWALRRLPPPTRQPGTRRACREQHHGRRMT